ncbi:MAG TPA: DUF4340 domain-containing protein [Polyangiaceae bacterium]
MKSGQGLILHVALLGVAGALAVRVLTRGETPAGAAEQVEVWGGNPGSLKSLTFESKNNKVSLDARKDSRGRWYVGTVEKTNEAPAGADAGAPMVSSMVGDGGAAPAAAGKPVKKTETTHFVAIKEGEKLAESIAPLMAMRALGKLPPAQVPEFGLDKPEGTLRVVFNDKTRTLTVGGLTPGGSDRYARNPDTGEAYAVSGDFVRSLMFADSRLIARELHDFEPDEVTRAVVTRAKSSRELVKMTGKKQGWADAKTPDKLDETAGNWMSKVERLTASQYMEQVGVPVLPEYNVLKVEYFNGSKPVGFLELIKIPDAKSNAGYIAKTEHTRWYAQVLKSSAEQIETDANSVLK